MYVYIYTLVRVLVRVRYLQVEVQMFQLYRDGLEDLLKEPKKKGAKDEGAEKPATLKITLAEHSPTGLVYVDGATSLSATTPGDVMKIFARGNSHINEQHIL